MVKKKWSLTQWISAFLEAEIANWEDPEPDDYDENHMPGGDSDYGYDDIDSEILESLVILSLAAALAFLLYYRNQRQRRQEEARRNQQLQQANQQADQVLNARAGQQQGQPHPPQQEDRGMFPNPDDPEFLDWAAGAVGH